MQRHPALVQLSHDHHHTLVWAKKLKRGETDGFAEFFARDVARHFREEEESVFPLLAAFAPELPPSLARAALDHARIRALAADPGPELGEALEAHVRLEERELFEELQRLVPRERLDELLPLASGGTPAVAPGSASPPPASRGRAGIADVPAPRRGGPVWGTESEDLNATVLEWPPGGGPPEHVNESRDVALAVLEGSGELEVDGGRRRIGAGEVVVLEKGTRRRVVAGPDGIRYATVHLRRGGLQIRRRVSAASEPG